MSSKSEMHRSSRVQHLFEFSLEMKKRLRYCTCLYAVIADGAVGASGRAIELASDAPLHAHRNPIDVRVLVQRGPELVLTVLVWGS